MLTTHKAGTCSDELTWLLSDTTRPTKHTSKLSTEMAEIPLSGARSVFCITRSISTATPWMPTLELSASTRTSAKCGSIWEVYTSPATIKSGMLSMPMNGHSSSIPRRTLSNSVYISSRMLAEAISLFPHHPSLSMFTLRNTRPHLATGAMEPRPTILQDGVMVSSMAEWTAMLLLDLLAEISHHHLDLLETWLEATRPLHSGAVPLLPLFSLPTSREDPCPVTLHLRLSKSANPNREVNEILRCRMAITGTPWADVQSTHHPLPDVEPTTLLIQGSNARESEMNGREGIELEHLLDLTLEDHRLDCPSTDKGVITNHPDSPPIPEITPDMVNLNKLLLLRTTPRTLDSTLGKGTEWMAVVHRSSKMILALTRLLPLLPVEPRPRGSRKKMSLGQHQRNPRTRMVNRQPRRPMAKVTVLPIDLSMKVSAFDSATATS